MPACAVPTIDISAFRASPNRPVAQLRHGAAETGFFYVEGHGISTAATERAFALGREFCDLSENTKARYSFVADRYLGW